MYYKTDIFNDQTCKGGILKSPLLIVTLLLDIMLQLLEEALDSLSNMNLKKKDFLFLIPFFFV